MSILNQTEPEKLISSLRGEIGEIIQSWIVLNIYNLKVSELQTEDILSDEENPSLNILNLIRSRLRDDIISRLSELSSTKHGRLNFHFAADKLKVQKQEVQEFSKFLNERYLVYRRNKNIAHKAMMPSWSQPDYRPHIPRFVIVKAIAWAVSIMKNFDKSQFGEDYKKIWIEERKRRYDLKMPASSNYILLPYKARAKFPQIKNEP